MRPYVAVPATAVLIWRAYSRNSLTPTGIIVASLTAVVHAIHPWSVFFALLAVFFLGGSSVSKVKHNVKAKLTISSTGISGGEGARTYVQVLANSLMASMLILLHRQKLLSRHGKQDCFPYGQDLLVVGIVSNYAAVAADTFSSELGILSHSKPRLITSWNLREVPAGTNGGVTLLGTAAGFLGAFTIALTSALLLPFCAPGTVFNSGTTIWSLQDKLLWVLGITIWGGFGSILDSALGGWFQASVVDVRTGKVVEGAGGKKVPTHGRFSKDHEHESRSVASGSDILDNNGVNLLMAFLMSVGGMLAAGVLWKVG